VRSRPFLPTFSWRNYFGSLNSRAYKEGQILASRDTPLPHNDEARYDAEGYLRGRDPEPVNAACKQRVEKLHNRVQQTRPQDWRDQPSEYNRAPREHRQHRTIEQPHEDGSYAVKNQCKGETIRME